MEVGNPKILPGSEQVLQHVIIWKATHSHLTPKLAELFSLYPIPKYSQLYFLTNLGTYLIIIIITIIIITYGEVHYDWMLRVFN